MGNKFLSHIREVDAICEVVRCFDDNNIIHVEGSVDPLRDVETINMELIFSDMEMMERRIEKQKKAAKSDKSILAEVEVLERVYAALCDGKCARTVDLTEEERGLLYEARLLTMKPTIYVANVSDGEVAGDYLQNEGYKKLAAHAESEDAEIIAVCAGIEAELAELEGEDKQMFLDDLGISESGLDKLIKASYSLLGLISFLTAGTPEVRAWTYRKGSKAPQCAGIIHTDFEKGFIRAEVIKYEDYITLGSEAACKEAGKMSIEGKEYVVQDGDIMHFRFNV